MKRFRHILLSLLLMLPFGAKAQEDSLRISLLSCSPGADIYEVYGHTGIRVSLLDQGRDLVFNYGMFDFSSPHFIWRFLLGRTDYYLGLQYYSDFCNEYRKRGSYVYEQELQLSKSELSTLLELLSENYRPENRVYRYNFFFNNCSTLARDIIEKAVDGKVNYPSLDYDQTLRDGLHEFNNVQPWGSFGEDLLIGARADRAATDRELDFLPLKLMHHLEKATVAGPDSTVRQLAGTPVAVVVPEHTVSHKTPLLDPLQAAVLFLLLILLTCIFDWYIGRSLYVADIMVLTLQGFAGIIIAFMYFFSEHPAVDTNWLVICLNPLPLFFCINAVIKTARLKKSWFIMADAIVIALFLASSPFMPQKFHPATLVILGAILLRLASTFILTIHKGHIRERMSRLSTTAAMSALLLIPITVNAQENKSPRMIVGFVVDRLDTYAMNRLDKALGKEGLLYIRDNSYGCTDVSFDYDGADKASATASLFTGTVPFYHGIISARWMDRKTLNMTSAVDDSRYKGINTVDKTSPARLAVTDMADKLKTATAGQGKVCAVGIDRDVTVLSAGHEADVVLWLNDEDTHWSTSEYYMETLPVWADTLNGFRDRDKVSWQHHTFRETDVAAVKSSPTGNERVRKMALAAIEGLGLGTDESTDMLTVSFSARGFQGAPADRFSDEYVDTYANIDRCIADIMAAANKVAGNNQVLFFLTGTGCQDHIQPNTAGTRMPTGTVVMEQVTALLNLYLSALYDIQGKWVETYHGNAIYLDHQLIDRNKLQLRIVTEDCVDFLTQVSGVRNILSQRDFMAGFHDQSSQRVRNAYSPSSSGDLIIEVLPGWSVYDKLCDETFHPRLSSYTFPFYIWGYGVRAESNNTPVSATVLAPTICTLAGMDIPDACTTQPIADLR